MAKRTIRAWVVLLAVAGVSSAAPEPDTAPAMPTGALTGLRAGAAIDAAVKTLNSGSADEKVRVLSTHAGVMRPDFKVAVFNCLSDSAPKVRKAALAAVLPCRVEAGYRALAAELAKDFHTYRRGRWGEDVPEGDLQLRYPGRHAKAFRVFGSAAIGALARQAKSDNAVTRYFAVTLLGRTGDPAAVAPLTPLLKDPKPDVRRRAARAMAVIGGHKALDALASLARATDEQLVREAAVGLSAHRDERAIALWTRLLREGKAYAAYRAGHWLSVFGPRRAVPLLIEGLSHKERFIRYQCHDSLRKLTHHDFGYQPGFKANDKTTPAERAKAIARWQTWWRKARRVEHYEILLAAMEPGPGRPATDEHKGRALLDLVKLGDTRAIPGLLRRYGDTKIDVPTANEKAGIDWALRCLSTRGLEGKAVWEAWFAAEGRKLPRVSPLASPYNALTCVAKRHIGVTAEHVSVDGRLAFVGTREAVEVWDVSEPSRPEILGRYPLHERCRNAAQQFLATRGRLYVAARGGLHAYRYDQRGGLAYVSTHDEMPHGGHFMISGRRLIVCNRNRAALYDTSGDRPRLLERCSFVRIRDFCAPSQRVFFTTADLSGGLADGLYDVGPLRLDQPVDLTGRVPGDYPASGHVACGDRSGLGGVILPLVLAEPQGPQSVPLEALDEAILA